MSRFYNPCAANTHIIRITITPRAKQNMYRNRRTPHAAPNHHQHNIHRTEYIRISGDPAHQPALRHAGRALIVHIQAHTPRIPDSILLPGVAVPPNRQPIRRRRRRNIGSNSIMHFRTRAGGSVDADMSTLSGMGMLPYRIALALAHGTRTYATRCVMRCTRARTRRSRAR